MAGQWELPGYCVLATKPWGGPFSQVTRSSSTALILLSFFVINNKQGHLFSFSCFWLHAWSPQDEPHKQVAGRLGGKTWNCSRKEGMSHSGETVWWGRDSDPAGDAPALLPEKQTLVYVNEGRWFCSSSSAALWAKAIVSPFWRNALVITGFRSFSVICLLLFYKFTVLCFLKRPFHINGD